MAKISLLLLFTFATCITAAPEKPDTSKCQNRKITPECCPDCFGVLPSAYSLTAVKTDNRGRHDPVYDGLKIENFALFQDRVGGYCPFTGEQASLCPNGTDMALSGTMHPLSLVPGGQDLYVNADGLISITVQHSHGFPPDSYPYYYGWTWTPYQIFPRPQRVSPVCPQNDAKYNCDPPTGYWTFQAPNATVGGVKACPNEFNGQVVSVYAVTPEFNRTDCVGLSGLGTHNYTGPNPPVWAY